MLMCKYEYEQLSVSTKRTMIFCHLKDDNTEELLRICNSQRYCNIKDCYIATDQRNNCKNYESV